MAETLSEEWFRRVWNEGDVDAIDELMAPRGVVYGIYGQRIRGRAKFRDFHAAFYAVFSRIRIEVVEEISCGQHVAIRCRAKLRHRTTGQNLTLLGTGFLVIRGGQIVEAHNHWDFLTLLEGMGLLPERSFELAITGALSPHPQISNTKPKTTTRTTGRRTRRRTTA